MSFMIAAEITGVVLAASRGFGPEVFPHRAANEKMFHNHAITLLQLEHYLHQQILLQIQQRQFNDRSRQFLDFIQVKVHDCTSINPDD